MKKANTQRLYFICVTFLKLQNHRNGEQIKCLPGVELRVGGLTEKGNGCGYKRSNKGSL